MNQVSLACAGLHWFPEKIMRRDGVYTSSNTKHKSEAKAPCTQAKHTQFEAKQDTNPKQNDKAYTSETHPIQSKTRHRDKMTSIPVHKRNTQFDVKRVTTPNKTTRHTSEIHPIRTKRSIHNVIPGTPLLQLCSRLLQL